MPSVKKPTLQPRRIRVAPVNPGELSRSGLVHERDLRRLALLTELVGGIDGKQHGFTFGVVGAVFLAIELDEPDILLANDQVAGARATRHKRWRQRVVMVWRSRHDFPLDWDHRHTTRSSMDEFHLQRF